VKSISAVIPVRDGDRYLDELLVALAREGVEEILVLDSGSCDRSLDIARSAGVELLEIPPHEFGHGRTRNLGAERTSGELICFLTQDATPVPGWLAAYREAFELDERVGAAYGPHLPRPDTSPMIARELTEFFAGFEAGEERTEGERAAHPRETTEGERAAHPPETTGGEPARTPVLQRAGGPTFLSNVNACYSRACWEEIRFREVPYSEDQAFGADMLEAGWLKVYHPLAAVLHAHDYGPVEFMRRYFDEYRGLRHSTGHVEPFSPTGTLRHVVREVSEDRRWMAEQDLGPARRARWTARATVHHTGRRVFSALGSRAERLPPAVRAGLSLERRADASTAGQRHTPADGARDSGANGAGQSHTPADGSHGSGGGGANPAKDASEPGADGTPTSLPPTAHVEAKIARDDYDVCMRVSREGPAPLLDPVEGMAERERLRLAMVIPPFSRGSGGHNTLFQIFSRLERRGHACSVWLSDFHGYMRAVWPAVLRNDIRDFFAPFQGPVYRDFGSWQGADIVIATGWQTVHESLLLDNCHARAYVVNDHEPEFFASSTERVLAEDTYRHDLHCIAASPWLRDLLVERYGASADAFELGADHDIYRPRPLERRRDTVVYYARHTTPRRAVPVGLMALSELKRRRPDTRVVLFGADSPLHAAFPYEHLGVLTPEQLSLLYSQATVGLCL
jgi:glycosyltransferase involved in cell wall biosynthesis